ncbi:MAG: Transcriptional regulator, TraR/DksA family [Parcubacteria group bacterium GW2011_GWA2_49_9]|nr:MAG: Transcriptional regulator, TraR/DksA family [Parcubacteria group bacterium GW2011_GWA2_49_9]
MTLDTTTFKKKLLTEKDLVEKELGTVGRRSPGTVGDWEPVASDRDSASPDRDEAAEKIESFEENTAIVRQLESRLGEVKDALERVENGSYGHCAVCEKEIEADRLSANPAATTCKAHMGK